MKNSYIMKNMFYSLSAILLFVFAVERANAEAIVTIEASRSLTFCEGDSVTLCANICQGCAAPYTFLWMLNDSIIIDSVQCITVKNSGAYCVKVTCGSGCKVTQCVRVTVGFKDNQVIITKPTCNGYDGKIEIKSSVQTECRKYQLTSGTTCTNQTTIQTSGIFNGLCAGNYCIRVLDECNVCDTCICVTIPPTDFEVIYNVTNESCYSGYNGAINEVFTLGGTPQYYYFWSNGATTKDITGLMGGTYYVTVIDAHNCIEIESFTIYEPASLGVTGVVTPLTSTGSNDGKIDITVTGGTVPYSYLWSNPPGGTAQNISDLSAGSYCVTVTDWNSCNTTGCWTVNPFKAAYLVINQQSGIVPDTIHPGTDKSFFSLYPNPTTSGFSLELNGIAETAELRVEIYGMHGCRIISEDLSGKLKYDLTLDGKPDGVYFIRVVTGKLTWTGKIIKQ